MALFSSRTMTAFDACPLRPALPMRCSRRGCGAYDDTTASSLPRLMPTSRVGVQATARMEPERRPDSMMARRSSVMPERWTCICSFESLPSMPITSASLRDLANASVWRESRANMRVRSVMSLRSDSVRTSWSVIGPRLPDPATSSTSAENSLEQKATGSSIVADEAISCTPGLSLAMRRTIQATLAPKKPVYWCASSTTTKRSEPIMRQNCSEVVDRSERARWYETKSKLVASMSGGSASRALR